MHDLVENDSTLHIIESTDDDVDEFVENAAIMPHDEQLEHLGNAIKVMDVRSTSPSSMRRKINSIGSTGHTS